MLAVLRASDIEIGLTLSGSTVRQTGLNGSWSTNAGDFVRLLVRATNKSRKKVTYPTHTQTDVTCRTLGAFVFAL